MRDHVGTVELSADGDGTRWSTRFAPMPTLPLAGGAVVAVVKQAIKALINGVSNESERRAADG